MAFVFAIPALSGVMVLILRPLVWFKSLFEVFGVLRVLVHGIFYQSTGLFDETPAEMFDVATLSPMCFYTS